ncbi:hypothetical protein Lfu02_73980 [Longispora fulva]|nr:hypothetical protein Lfu02_73980 [Longispora fulva]
MGCNADRYAIGGFTVQDSTTPTGTAPAVGGLWYSPACHAAWADYTTHTEGDFRDLIVFVTSAYSNTSRNVDSRAHGPGTYETPMADWDNSFTYCATYIGVGDDSGSNPCISGTR